MSEPPEPDKADLRRQRDFDDLQNELAGRETGRMVRFGVSSARAQQIEERKRRERVFRDELERLLATDPEYQAIYEDLGGKLRDAETGADETISALLKRIASLEDEIVRMQDNAVIVPGIGRVYRFADGRVVDENRVEVDPALVADIVWPPGATTGEAYFAAQDELEALRSHLTEWESYRVDTLGDIRDRYDNRKEPMSKDDMRDALEQIDQSRPDALSFEASNAPSEAAADFTPQAFPTIPSSSQ